MTRYQIHTLFVLVLVLVLTAATTHAAQSVRLFEGKDIDQWVIENDGQFVVEDGLLKLNGGTGWLRSDETFEDYTLVVEFRFLEEGANSGIFVRTGPTSNDDEKGWPNDGYQIQCMDTIVGETPLGAMILYGAPPAEHEIDLEALERAYKPTGEWHRFEITCRDEKITVKLNGETITRCTGIENLNGHVGIQGEDGKLEFRKVTVIMFPKKAK
jgi:hypothetical protein